jgi:hypothetical protein
MNEWVADLSRRFPTSTAEIAATTSPVYYIAQTFPLFIAKTNNAAGRVIGWRVQDGRGCALVFWETHKDRGPSVVSEDDMETSGFGDTYAAAGEAVRGFRDGY